VLDRAAAGVRFVWSPVDFRWPRPATGLTRSFLRALACVLWPVGLLWSGVSPARSSLQDILFRSIVVYDAHPYVDARSGRSHAQKGA
jgi:uncharacterized RDD family membrane protein YckC